MEHGLNFPLQWLTPNVARPVHLMVLYYCVVYSGNTLQRFFSELLLPPTSHRKARIIHHSVAILKLFSYDHYWFHLYTLMLYHHVGSTIASDSFWLSCPSCKNVRPCGRNQWAPRHTQLALEGDMLKHVWWLEQCKNISSVSSSQ